MADEKSLAQLAADGKFDKFEEKFTELVYSHLADNETMIKLKNARQQILKLIKSLEACQ